MFSLIISSIRAATPSVKGVVGVHFDMLSDGEVPLFLDLPQNPVDSDLWKPVAKFRLKLELSSV